MGDQDGERSPWEPNPYGNRHRIWGNKLKDLPVSERPRERMMKLGPASLSEVELLAVILRVGYKESVLNVAQRILKWYNLKKLSNASIGELKQIYGINDAKACQIAACFELSRRLESYNDDLRPKVSTPRDVYELLGPRMRGIKKEEFVCLYLDTKNQLLRDEVVSMGSLSSSVVHPREVFKGAIQESAASLILVHNHPSGDPSPSGDDLDITERLMNAGKLLGIEVLDHIIIGDGRFVSLKELKMLKGE